MNILMINSNRFKAIIPVIPIGLCSVSAALERGGHTVRVLDLMFSPDPSREIEESIKSFKPDLIGVSIRNIDDSHLHFLLDEVKQMVIEPCKRYFPGPIIIGGSAVGIGGREMLDFFELNYAISGDGELSMLRFVDCLERGESLREIAGLIIRKDREIITENSPAIENCLERLPNPSPHKYINLSQYVWHDSHVQIETKRGCALKCSYCVYSKLVGSRFRLKEPERVVAEIEAYHREAGISSFQFTDSPFNIPLAHCKAVLKTILAQEKGFKFETADINPGEIDEELVELLYKNNFSKLCITVESGSDRVLKSLNKNFDSEQVVKAAELLHTNFSDNHNLQLYWQFMLGAPEESESTLEETFGLIKKIVHPGEQVYIIIGIRLYEGAPITAEQKRRGKALPSSRLLKPYLLEPDKISLAEIEEIVRGWMEEVPGIVIYE